MAKQENISPSENDRRLAQEIGRVLPNIDKLESLDDPFLNTLLSYRKTQVNREISVPAESVWKAVESEINESRKKPASILNLYPAFRRIAVAASIILAALAAFWIYQANRGDILIAESTATIKKIELKDGSLVTLRPYSKLYQTSMERQQHNFRLTGEAYFEVTSDPDRIFSVSTRQSKVEVLGTRFILKDWGDISEVFLEEGRIRFTSVSTQHSVELEEGEASLVSSEQISPDILQSDATEYKDWLRDELVFKNKSAGAVFNELEHHFNIRINSEIVMDEKDLSGSISLDDLQSVLQNLELVLDGTFTQTGERTYTFRSN